MSSVFLLLIASGVVAHDHTAAQFVKAQAAQQAKAEQQTEAAPAADDAAACKLTIELTLEGVREPVGGLVRITNLASGKPLAFRDEIHRAENWYTLPAGGTFVVPRAKLKVEAFHGLETELAVREIVAAAEKSQTLRLPLVRFYDARVKGLVAGNTHLHLMKLTHEEMDRYLRTVPLGDGLDLVFVSLLRRIPDERDYITNTLSEGDFGRLSQGAVKYAGGQEHRHNFGTGGEGFGHVMLLDILKRIEPVSIGPGIMREGTDGIPIQRGIRAARADGATVIWCHNTFGHEDIPNWVSGLVHAQNIFDGGNHGGYADTFYRYLAAGMKVPFSTGTDWFIYDFSRVYVPLAGAWSPKRWLAELAAGKSTITNGTFLELIAGSHKIGDTIVAVAGDEIRVQGRAFGRNDFQRVELIHNGEVVHSVAAKKEGSHSTASLDHTLKVAGPGWFALRIPDSAGKNELSQPLFAHTSPIYVEVGGRRLFRPEVARGMLAEMKDSLKVIESKATFADDEERQAVLGVYREASTALQKRIDEHGK